MSISIAWLESEYRTVVEYDPRAAAQIAYALAFRYRNEDVDGRRNFDAAKRWAMRSIGLLDGLPESSVTEVASTQQVVGGIAIPDLLHSGVVRERLSDVLA